MSTRENTALRLSALRHRPVYELEHVRDALRSGRLKITAARLRVIGRRDWSPWVSALSSFSSEALLSTIEALLEIATEQQSAPGPAVVWSGLEVPRSRVARTDQVLDRLLRQCERDILFAGYSFYRARTLLTPLVERMTKGARVRVVLDGTWMTLEPDTPRETAMAWLRGGFAKTAWPDGARLPELYCDPRTLVRTRNDDGSVFAPYSMHAKCLIVDRTVALVGSANFTKRAQENNLEVGALIHDESYVRTLLHQWESAIQHGIVVRVPTRRTHTQG